MAGINYPKLPYIPVLLLRVNDVGKIRSFSILCRWTWWTTFVPGLTSNSLSLELQNFLKFNDYLLQSAVLTVNFKNSYLPVCAYVRISSGTKVDRLEELYKISWKTPMLTHIILVNTIRVYRITSDNLFPPKLISKTFLFIFIIFSYSKYAK